MTAPTHLPRPLDQLSVESQGGAPGAAGWPAAASW